MEPELQTRHLPALRAPLRAALTLHLHALYMPRESRPIADRLVGCRWCRAPLHLESTCPAGAASQPIAVPREPRLPAAAACHGPVPVLRRLPPCVPPAAGSWFIAPTAPRRWRRGSAAEVVAVGGGCAQCQADGSGPPAQRCAAPSWGCRCNLCCPRSRAVGLNSELR